jgi:hypothetical protein
MRQLSVTIDGSDATIGAAAGTRAIRSGFPAYQIRISRQQHEPGIHSSDRRFRDETAAPIFFGCFTELVIARLTTAAVGAPSTIQIAVTDNGGRRDEDRARRHGRRVDGGCGSRPLGGELARSRPHERAVVCSVTLTAISGPHANHGDVRRQRRATAKHVQFSLSRWTALESVNAGPKSDSSVECAPGRWTHLVAALDQVTGFSRRVKAHGHEMRAEVLSGHNFVRAPGAMMSRGREGLGRENLP